MASKTMCSILRSKARWYEQEERNTKYVYGLEKKQHQIKTRAKLKLGENSYTEDQFEILETEKVFYESLYQCSNTNATTFENSPFFSPENITTLNEVEKGIL